MTKSRDLGFKSYISTDKSFFKLFDYLKKNKYIPSWNVCTTKLNFSHWAEVIDRYRLKLIFKVNSFQNFA